VGLGNPLAGSDGFGVAVIAQIGRQDSLPDGVAIVDAGTDLMDHIDAFLAYDDVVLVDVIVGTSRPGDITVVDEATFGAWPASAASCHHLSPLVAVKLFRALHPQAATRVTLIGYQADEITLGAALPDAAVSAGAEAVIRWLMSGS
jgi:hydrogenase maturation protease